MQEVSDSANGLRIVRFAIDLNPAELPTAQQKGVRIIKVHGKQMPMFFEKPAVKRAHITLVGALGKYAPPTPLDGPIVLRVKYFYPWPKGTPKCKQVVAPMLQRPDVDNVQKLVQDAMTECGFWHDDSQIWKLELEKMRTPFNPQIQFEIVRGATDEGV